MKFCCLALALNYLYKYKEEQVRVTPDHFYSAKAGMLGESDLLGAKPIT